MQIITLCLLCAIPFSLSAEDTKKEVIRSKEVIVVFEQSTRVVAEDILRIYKPIRSDLEGLFDFRLDSIPLYFV